MVSKANEDLPEPLKPVMTTSLSRGILSVRSLRLCSRAPPILINSLLTTADFGTQPIGKFNRGGGERKGRREISNSKPQTSEKFQDFREIPSTILPSSVNVLRQKRFGGRESTLKGTQAPEKFQGF